MEDRSTKLGELDSAIIISDDKSVEVAVPDEEDKGNICLSSFAVICMDLARFDGIRRKFRK